ncbi:odorant receptor 129-1 [Nerophis ophidion]|uniref:odorant receptor 131-2-like n=1 Tax=Nerophis ophidion TaxID=159077 RepID=UPI002ADF1CB9|nr:odorant receptor 131-2-like [Nerophis ophidion]XP_061734365.1 odorant receptor 129-1 [Nerophis ophidion]
MQPHNLSLSTTSHGSLSVIIKVCAVTPFFCVFLCCIIVMLYIFASHRHFLEKSRYTLFACMLVNDTLQLFFSVLLFLLSMGRVTLAVVYCAPLLFVSLVTFQNTPLILAAMSLERYVAIVYPLHRPAMWRSDRLWVMVLSLLILSCIFPIAMFSIRQPDPAEDILTTLHLCKNFDINSSPTQTILKVGVHVSFFSLVAVIVLFTYVRILLETRKMRQDRASVGRAMHTVMLHAFQLLLCMLAFLYPITVNFIQLHDHWSKQDVAFFNYFCFMVIPRFLSPLIYGFRDQSLRGYIRKTFNCCFQKANLQVRT